MFADQVGRGRLCDMDEVWCDIEGRRKCGSVKMTEEMI